MPLDFVLACWIGVPFSAIANLETQTTRCAMKIDLAINMKTDGFERNLPLKINFRLELFSCGRERGKSTARCVFLHSGKSSIHNSPFHPAECTYTKIGFFIRLEGAHSGWKKARKLFAAVCVWRIFISLSSSGSSLVFV